MAEAYAKANGIALRRQSEYVDIDPDRSKRLADAYAAMPHAPSDPAVKEAYQNLIRQTEAQYRALEAAGYKFWLFGNDNDPYAGNPWAAMADLRENQVMAVYSTVAGFGTDATFDPKDNPLLADTGIKWPSGSPTGPMKPVLANDLFRAVHDAFGHGLEGAGFRARGEENAWQAHVRLFTGSAVAAITSETRGQNSWLNFGPSGESNQSASVFDTDFAQQKTGLLPAWTWTEGLAGDQTRYSARIKQTETPEFKKWFGDSKVVDADGKPLVVYHGTQSDFAKFQESDDGIYFAGRPDAASAYAYGPDGDGEAVGPSSGANVTPVYLSLQNPLVVTDEWLDAFAGVAPKDPFKRGHSFRDDFVDSEVYARKAVVAEAKRLGHDGMILPNDMLPESVMGGDWSEQPAYVAFNPAQIKSAIGNNGSFDGANPDIRHSARDPIGFYSELSNKVSSASMNQAPAQAWKTFIKALTQKGVKQDEIEWSGVMDWLDAQEGKIKREQVVQYLDANGVKVNEVVLGAPDYEIVQGSVESFERIHGVTVRYEIGEGITEMLDGDGYRINDYGNYLGKSGMEDMDYLDDIIVNGRPTDVRYDKYTLPGGENYREVLLTLPVPSEARTLKDRYRLNDLEESGLADSEEAKSLREKRQDAAYQSSHWDQPNVLAHIRVNDRTDADGNKVLFVEELQSDWSADGRKKGFQSDKTINPTDAEIREYFGLKDGADPADYRQEMIDRERRIAKNRGVPSAPFVTKTDGWLNLALKRIIAMAVDGGYDSVAFVNGEQSADRYDLSKSIESIGYDPKTGRLQAYDKSRMSVIDKTGVSEDQLEDYIGKEVAQRLLATEPMMGKHLLDGEQIKVGGEGMKTFYDSIVPNAVKALLKKVGGGQMRTVGLMMGDQFAGSRKAEYRKGEGIFVESRSTEERIAGPFDTYNDAAKWMEENPETLPQPGFDITPEMASQVQKGLPQFSARISVDGVDRPLHDSNGKRIHQSDDGVADFWKWFGDSKVVDKDGKPLVVYHGTGADIASFAPEKSADGVFHFAIDSAMANRFSVSRAKDGVRGANVMPVYLSIKNPKRVSFINTMEINAAKAEGYDGLISDSRGHIVAFDPTQIKSAIGNNGDFNGENPDIRYSRRAGTSNWDEPIPSKFDDLLYKFQDKLIDLKRVIQDITKWTGKLADDVNVYLQEELFHGRAAKRVQDFVSRELTPALKELSGYGMTLADIEEYLHARHAVEANRVIAQRNPGVVALQDGGSGMTNADARQYMASLSQDEAQKLASVAAKFDAIMAETNQMRVAYGLESQDAINAWGRMFNHYIPLYREDKDGGRGIGQGFSVRGKETKGRTGSTRKVVDIVAHIAQARENTIVRGEKNRVSTALVGLVKLHPNPDFWRVGPPPKERVYNPDTGLVEERVDPLYKSRDNVVISKTINANGQVEEVAVTFNEDNERAMRLASALKNLDAGNLEGLWGTFASVSRYFAAINTQYNPVFGVVNLVRDIQGAMFNLGTTPLAGKKGKISKDAIQALWHIYSDLRASRNGGQSNSPWAQIFEQFQEDGGQTGFRQLFETAADRTDDIRKTVTPDAWMETLFGKVVTANGALKMPAGAIKKGSGVVFDWLSDYNEAMENAIRVSAYKNALDSGLTREQAASLAKNLTVNFNRKGQMSMQAGALYAFFNAAIQGSTRLAETLFTMEPGQPKTIRLSPLGKKIVYGGMLFGSMQALVLAGAGFGENEPPEFVRERSIVIPVGGKDYVSIPMPLGLHVIPGLGRHATELALSGFKDPTKRLFSVAGMMADAFNPIGNAGLSMQTLTPTAFDPLVALTENRDWTGKPIARTSFNKDVPGFTQHKDSATYIAKLMAEGINFLSGGNKYVAGVLSPTPDQIDYLIGQVTGGVGRELSKVEQTTLGAITGEEVPIYKVPLVGRFVGSASGQGGESNAFYANTGKLNRLETEIKGLEKDGKKDEARELKRQPEAYLIAQANAAEREIQKLRKQKREMVANDAPREQVRQIEDRITATMSRLNRAVEARAAS